jgi:hypothetical protein
MTGLCLFLLKKGGGQSTEGAGIYKKPFPFYISH